MKYYLLFCLFLYPILSLSQQYLPKTNEQYKTIDTIINNSSINMIMNTNTNISIHIILTLLFLIF